MAGEFAREGVVPLEPLEPQLVYFWFLDLSILQTVERNVKQCLFNFMAKQSGFINKRDFTGVTETIIGLPFSVIKSTVNRMIEFGLQDLPPGGFAQPNSYQESRSFPGIHLSGSFFQREKTERHSKSS